MLLGASAGYDGGGNGAYLFVYNSGTNTRALQFEVPGVEVISSPNLLSGDRSGALGSPVPKGLDLPR
jgi:hypothetical protein